MRPSSSTFLLLLALSSACNDAVALSDSRRVFQGIAGRTSDYDYDSLPCCMDLPLISPLGQLSQPWARKKMTRTYVR